MHITPLPLPVLSIQRMVSPNPSLRSAGIHLRRGGGVVSAGSFPFPITSRARPCLPPLRAPAPPLSLSYPRLPFECSLCCLLLIPSNTGRNVVTLPQTSVGHADVIGIAALASCGLEPRRETAFATDVNGQTIRSCWSHGVRCQRCPLFLHPFLPLNID